MMGVKLRGFGAVMDGMRAMARGRVRMMRRGFDLFFLVMFGGHAVMVRCFFVMIGGGMVMGAGRMLVRHGGLRGLASKLTAVPRNKHVRAFSFSRTGAGNRTLGARE